MTRLLIAVMSCQRDRALGHHETIRMRWGKEVAGVIFGLFDRASTTGAAGVYMTCAIYPGQTSCTLVGSAVLDSSNNWTYPSTASFSYGDDISFTAYISDNNGAYTVQNLTWRLE